MRDLPTTKLMPSFHVHALTLLLSRGLWMVLQLCCPPSPMGSSLMETMGITPKVLPVRKASFALRMSSSLMGRCWISLTMTSLGERSRSWMHTGSAKGLFGNCNCLMERSHDFERGMILHCSANLHTRGCKCLCACMYMHAQETSSSVTGKVNCGKGAQGASGCVHSFICTGFKVLQATQCTQLILQLRTHPGDELHYPLHCHAS